MRRTMIAARLLCMVLVVSCSSSPEQKQAAPTASQAPIQVEPIVNDKALLIVSSHDDLCMVDANLDGVPDVVLFSLWRPGGDQWELELRLAAIDGLTGATLWRSDRHEPMLFPSVRCADPIIFSYMKGAGSFAFDARSGKLIAQLRGSASMAEGLSHFLDEEIERRVGGLTVVLRDRKAPMLPPFANGEKLPMTLSASDETGERWSHSVGLYQSSPYGLSMTHTEDVIIVTGQEHRYGYDQPDSVIGVEAATGIQLWKRSFGRAFVVASGSRAYLSTDDVLRKIDPRTGKDEWFARASNP